MKLSTLQCFVLNVDMVGIGTVTQIIQNSFCLVQCNGSGSVFMFLDIPNPVLLVRGTDPDSDPSIIKQK